MPEERFDHKNFRGQREQQFVLDVLQCFIKSENKELLIPKYLDWAWVNNIVFNHNLGPIFKHTLAEHDVPAPISTQWHQDQIVTFVKNTRALVSAIKLFRIMDAAAIPSAVIRGISLSNHIYPGDCLSLRPMCDVDMLIRPCDRKNLETILHAEGIRLTRRLRSQLVYRVNDIAYARRFFDGDSLGCYLRRKRNLFFVAERPITKLKQVCRLFAVDELCEFARILRQTIYR